MLRVREIRFGFLLAVLLAVVLPLCAYSQDDANEMPLGDVARKFRKMSPPPREQVIDDDNLSAVMQEAEKRRLEGWTERSLTAGAINNFRPPAPDVTCSLAFTMNARALLTSQYTQMDLPASEVVKLAGPATIEGDALSVSVFNGTQWHVSEVSIALTVVRKAVEEPTTQDATKEDAAEPPKFLPEPEPRPEKKPDLTVIYRMRAAAPPMSTTMFSAPLNLDLAADEEWHWAIVQARGYPPQDYFAQTAEQFGLPSEPDAPSASPPIPHSVSPTQTPQ